MSSNTSQEPARQKLFQTQILQSVFQNLANIDNDEHLEAFILAILRKYESKDYSSLEKFQSVFENLNRNDFTLLIQSIVYIYETALFHNLSPGKLHEALQAANCTKAALLATIWKEAPESKSFIKNAREYSLNDYSNLNHIDWRLGIRVSDDLLGNRKDMYAQWVLDVGSKSQNHNKLEFGMDQSEMYEFFQKLEQIQAQLDQLSES